MTSEKRISTRFRQRLKLELSKWSSEGFISSEQTHALIQRYNLESLEAESKNLLLSAVYIIGTILIGAGVISFVAAHWNTIHDVVKIVMIVALMLLCHIGGFCLWRIYNIMPRLGHALVVLGTLVFGANIGLLAQILHIKADFYNGFFAWAAGAIIMAYLVASIPNAVIAVIVSFVGFCICAGQTEGICWFFPFAAAAVFLPFSYIRRSSFLFTLTLIVIGLSIMISSSEDGNSENYLFASSVAASLLFLAFGAVSQASKNFQHFTTPSMVLASLAVILSAYSLSFRFVAEDIDYSTLAPGLATLPMAVACIAALAMGGFGIKSFLSNVRLRSISFSILISIALLATGLLIEAYSGSWSGIFMLFFANLALLVIAAGLLYSSFVIENRWLFWSAVLLIALLITSRFFEYETHLMLKAAVFIACGVAVLVSGVKFESYLKKRRSRNE